MQLKCWCGGARGRQSEIESSLYGPSLKYKNCSRCGTYRQTNEIDMDKRHSVYAAEIEKRLTPEFQAPLKAQVQLLWSKLDAYAWPIMAREEQKNLLDVGCSTGTFLDHAKQFGLKFNLFGQDINKKALENVKSTGNLKSESIENCGYEDEFFDIITCHEVIEHVENPLEYLKTMFRILKTGGIIQLTTPNSFDMDPATWPMARPDHLWLFNSESIRRMCDAVGIHDSKVAIEDISKFTYEKCMMVIIKK